MERNTSIRAAKARGGPLAGIHQQCGHWAEMYEYWENCGRNSAMPLEEMALSSALWFHVFLEMPSLKPYFVYPSESRDDSYFSSGN